MLPRRGLRPAGRRQRGAQRRARRDASWRRSAGRRSGAPSSPSWSGRRRGTSPTPDGAAPTGAVGAADPARCRPRRARRRAGRLRRLRQRRAQRVRPPVGRGVGERTVAGRRVAAGAAHRCTPPQPARSWWEERARANLAAELRQPGSSTCGRQLPWRRRRVRLDPHRDRCRARAGGGDHGRGCSSGRGEGGDDCTEHVDMLTPLAASALVDCVPACSAGLVDWRGGATTTGDRPGRDPARRRRDAGHRRTEARPHRQGRTRRVGGRQGARSAHLRDPGGGAVRLRLGAVA